MKKLIVLLGAVAAIGIAQAASVTWSMTQVKTPADATVSGSGYLAMVFDATTSQSDVIAAVLAKDATTLGNLANDWKQTTVSNAAGLLSSSGNGTYAASDTFSVYVVLFDASTVADAGNYFITATKSGSINAAGSNATLAFGTFASQAAAAGSSGGWTAVPEPTSGLLMLLGMAGLALRRRCA